MGDCPPGCHISDGTGNPLTASALGNPFAYTGQRYDAAVALYHFKYRSYSPRLGRWMQRDPLGLWYGMNLYEYARSAPGRWVDPLGLLWGEYDSSNDFLGGIFQELIDGLLGEGTLAGASDATIVGAAVGGGMLGGAAVVAAGEVGAAAAARAAAQAVNIAGALGGNGGDDDGIPLGPEVPIDPTLPKPIYPPDDPEDYPDDPPWEPEPNEDDSPYLPNDPFDPADPETHPWIPPDTSPTGAPCEN